MHSSFFILVRRTFANLMDTALELSGGLLGSYFGMLVAALLETTSNGTAAHMQSSMWSGFGFGLIFWTLSISFLNRVLIQGISRASIGKKLFRLELISNGSALTWSTMVGRWMMSFGSFALLGIGYVYAFFNKEGRTLHDLVANTDVIPLYESANLQVEHKDYVPMPMPAYSTLHKLVVFTQVTAERPTVSMVRMPSVPPVRILEENVFSLDEARKAKVKAEDDSGSGSQAA